MVTKQKWYDNRSLMFFLIMFIYPIGVIGIWLRNTTPVKKVVYSVVGFFTWIFVFPITLGIILLIVLPSKDSENNFQYGNEAFNNGEYMQAVNYYNNVESDYEFYNEAMKKKDEAQQKYNNQQATLKAYKTQALKEIKVNTASIIENKKPYSVLLYDADIEVNGTDSTFAHQYKIVLEDSIGTPYDTVTNWIQVSDTAFDYYINDIGMTLTSANNNTVNEYSSPPGYNNYVNNTRYGSWQTNSSGNSVWEFYGKYAFLRTMFGFNQPIYRNDYYDYSDYYRGRSSYYGQSTGTGRYAYGTQSAHSSSLNPQNKFKSSVQGRVNRSGSRNVSSMNSFRSNVRSRTTRSSGTISRSSSSRTSSFRSGSSSSGK